MREEGKSGKKKRGGREGWRKEGVKHARMACGEWGRAGNPNHRC